eukprot:GEMP01055679.1.p1 GENE.GEMP01055679.1~~GEMP01055679.1.p1  ORF type:complete len:302 (-),score=52.10 GEMP01055679.1:346-1251(-)
MASSRMQYVVPEARLRGDRDLFATFIPKSVTIRRFLAYIQEASKNIAGEQTMEMPSDPIVILLTELEEAINRFPPIEQPMRFGNKAFVQWWEWMSSITRDRLDAICPPEKYGNATEELAPYFIGSFGEPARIDYGTGHESCFLAFLFCCREVGLYDDNKVLILGVFNTYLRVVRKLHSTYVMEPAGSHGVWGLDDFHHLPFIFGAAQFSGARNGDFLSPDKLLARCREIHGNMFADEIVAILDVKTGAPFGETSPVLYDVISTILEWDKIFNGMIKMYEGEVIKKFPVMQHFLFGSILPFE